MRISDWSSDVCSSDLRCAIPELAKGRNIRKQQRASRHRRFQHGEPERFVQRRGNENARALPPSGHGSLPQNAQMLDLAQNDTFAAGRSEEHTSEIQSLMRTTYVVFCLKKKLQHTYKTTLTKHTHSSRTHNH